MGSGGTLMAATSGGTSEPPLSRGVCASRHVTAHKARGA